MIYEDKSLAQEIEQYLANKEAMEMMKRDREEARRRGLDQVEIEDKDFQDFRDAIHEDKKEDYQLENGEEQ